MEEIENYRVKRRTRLHGFVYKNLGIIITVFSAIGVLVGIFGTLVSQETIVLNLSQLFLVNFPVFVLGMESANR